MQPEFWKSLGPRPTPKSFRFKFSSLEQAAFCWLVFLYAGKHLPHSAQLCLAGHKFASPGVLLKPSATQAEGWPAAAPASPAASPHHRWSSATSGPLPPVVLLPLLAMFPICSSALIENFRGRASQSPQGILGKRLAPEATPKACFSLSIMDRWETAAFVVRAHSMFLIWTFDLRAIGIYAPLGSKKGLNPK